MRVPRPLFALALLVACGGDDPPVSGDAGDTDATDASGDAADAPDDAPDAAVDVPDADVTDTADAPDADASDAADTTDVADAPDDGTDTSDTSDASDGSGDTAPAAVCGNGIIEAGEDCEGGDLDGQTCLSLGLTDGVLTCGSDCAFRTGQCAYCPNAICEGAEDFASCPGDCGAVDVAVGPRHACAVLRDHSVWCWGAWEGHRAGGLGDVRTPHRIDGLSDVIAVEVAIGEAHTCVVDFAQNAWCWGRNGFGEVAPDVEDLQIWPPRYVRGLPPPIGGLALGAAHSCGLNRTDGSVWCWGRSSFGAVGERTVLARRAAPAMVAPTETMRAIEMSAGEDHTCAWIDQGRGWCWGRGDQHQVGGADSTWAFTPRQISNDVWAAGTGANHSCATVLNLAAPPQFSGLFCWGSNAFGQLGAAPTDDFIGPQRVLALRPVQLDGGDAFTCTLDGVTGEVSCWGDNARGQLGDGTYDARFAPGVTLPLGAPAVEVEAAGSVACALLDDASVRCWGDNTHGQLGDGTVLPSRAEPVAPVGLGGAP